MRWCFSTLRSITALAAAMVVAGPAAADDPIPDDALGLSRTSVFDTPVPEAYDYEGSASRIDLQTSRQAPVIPHEMRAYESITTGRNRCLRCHMEPALIGTEIPAGEATPMPADHYLQLGDEESTAKVSGSRWVCTQCHVGQVNVAPLVDNSSVN